MVTLSLNEFADRLNELIPELLRGVVRRNADEVTEGKITMPQLLVCQHLCKEGHSNMTSLANYMGVTTAAVTGIVDRLVKGGYAGRHYAHEDRRIINIELTARGREMVRKFKEQKRRMAIEVFGNLSEADRRNYLRILTRIKGVLAREQAG
ncbi:MAG: MarR family transcriptional regulator [Candidatus Omnitrophica bacterium]|nr:MarR family transcriptional regulator [Candidatus Omnitrophota bacterium]MBL7210301.1 MarR family transcriptional regulator [Candidatus Omnitrophota bacterium]